jgi:hypothetical protein
MRAFVLAAAIFAALLLLGKAIDPTSVVGPGGRVNGQEYADLARGFLRGVPWLVVPDGAVHPSHDLAPFRGKLHLPYGPLPAFLYAPFVPFFPTHMPVGILGGIVVWLVFALAVRLAAAAGVPKRDAFWLAAAYAFGSAVLPLTLGLYSSWFAAIIANVFLLAALVEHLTGRRPAVIGALIAGAMLSRSVSVIGLTLFIALGMLLAREDARSKARRLVVLGLALAAAALTIGLYNQTRFGSPFESGYAWQWEKEGSMREATHGPWSGAYASKNAWYLLYAPPALDARFPFLVPDPFGMGILFTSPYLVYLFRSKWRDPAVRMAFLAACIGIVPALLFPWTGYAQIGYRYAVDSYPLLFFVLASAFLHRMPAAAKALIAASVALQVSWTARFIGA